MDPINNIFSNITPSKYFLNFHFSPKSILKIKKTRHKFCDPGPKPPTLLHWFSFERHVPLASPRVRYKLKTKCADCSSATWNFSFFVVPHIQEHDQFRRCNRARIRSPDLTSHPPLIHRPSDRCFCILVSYAIHWIRHAGGRFGYILPEPPRWCPHQSPLSRRCRVITLSLSR